LAKQAAKDITTPKASVSARPALRSLVVGSAAHWSPWRKQDGHLWVCALLHEYVSPMLLGLCSTTLTRITNVVSQTRSVVVHSDAVCVKPFKPSGNSMSHLLYQ
jgi:hypothetical protein